MEGGSSRIPSMVACAAKGHTAMDEMSSGLLLLVLVDDDDWEVGFQWAQKDPISRLSVLLVVGSPKHRQALASYPPAPGTKQVRIPGRDSIVALHKDVCSSGSIGTLAASPICLSKVRDCANAVCNWTKSSVHGDDDDFHSVVDFNWDKVASAVA